MAVLVATLLVACDSGPSESEFVAACLPLHCHGIRLIEFGLA